MRPWRGLQVKEVLAPAEHWLRRLPARTRLGAKLVLALLALLYLLNWSGYYLSLEPGGARRILVRSGLPFLRLLPGFDRVVVDTGYTAADLTSVTPPRLKLARNQHWGFWLYRPDGYHHWADQLAEALAVQPQVLLL
ncbi:MAG: hypothetical protein HY706_00455, partial [Candidatus Hydrogenedentes bacterium]|nr:hypothetical protein [Candidatus Hydrogenedentota bacterium]